LRRKTTQAGAYVKQDRLGLNQFARVRKHAGDASGADRMLHFHSLDDGQHVAARGIARSPSLSN
jgi:hypothetical protein